MEKQKRDEAITAARVALTDALSALQSADSAGRHGRHGTFVDKLREVAFQAELAASEARILLRSDRHPLSDIVDAARAKHEAARCPACTTLLDDDGYCTDVGCVNCGKTV